MFVSTTTIRRLGEAPIPLERRLPKRDFRTAWKADMVWPRSSPALAKRPAGQRNPRSPISRSGYTPSQVLQGFIETGAPLGISSCDEEADD